MSLLKGSKVSKGNLLYFEVYSSKFHLLNTPSLGSKTVLKLFYKEIDVVVLKILISKS